MSDIEGSARQTRVARFKLLTEGELPRQAREQRWPLRLDHCFKRVCLDWACQDCWYGHIRRPAELHADWTCLDRAVRCAEEILEGGSALLKVRNAASLRWRGKLMPPSAPASDGKEDRRQ